MKKPDGSHPLDVVLYVIDIQGYICTAGVPADAQLIAWCQELERQGKLYRAFETPAEEIVWRSVKDAA